MKEKIKNFYYALREICQGSGKISLLSILIITVIIYGFLFITSNQQILPLLTSNINKQAFPSTQEYLTYLESRRIDLDINKLVPILSTIVLLIVPIGELKTNIALRLLPISIWTKIIALLIIIVTVTILSFGIVQLLDYGILHYIRAQYLSEVINLNESIGELYKKNNGGISFLFDPSYANSFKGIRDLSTIIIISLVFNTISLVINLIFNKYSLVKGIGLAAIVMYIAFNLRQAITHYGGTTIETNSIVYTTVYYIYFPILFICFLLSFYYLLKQKER